MTRLSKKTLGLLTLVLITGVALRARGNIDLFTPARPKPPPAPRVDSSGPSPVIYPAQRLPIKFSHARHLARGATCLGCHEPARTSLQARDNLLPAESACQVCHAIDRQQPDKRVDGPPAACAACHIGSPAERIDIPPPNLKFNHRLHADLQIDCARCHGDLREVDLATRAQLPKMAVCLSCHRDAASTSGPVEDGKVRRPIATARCTACHLQQGNGTLEVRFAAGLLVPSGELRGDDHGAGFRRDHRMAARNDADYCASCHTQSYCQRCHNGVVKPLDIHGGDYVNRHGLDARRNQPDCGTCHRRQTFCIACHERLGVVSNSTLPGSPSPSSFFPAAPRRFHPEGWASSFSGQNLHAQEAQRNMRSCASCHREQTCLECHSALPGSRVTGGANPHPADWVASGRCRALASRNGRLCLKCHRDASVALSCGG